MSDNIEHVIDTEYIAQNYLKHSAEMSEDDECTLYNSFETRSASDTECDTADEQMFSASEDFAESQSEEEPGSASQNGDSEEEWNGSFSEYDWDITPSTDDSWPQSDNATNKWEVQDSFVWPDTVGPQPQIDWEFETAEAPEPEPRPEPIMIDTLEKLDEFLPLLSQLKNGVELALDLEGTPEKDDEGKPIPGGGFGRTGSISWLTMTIISMDKTYLFDVWQLKEQTFERESEDGLSLKKVLESQDRIQLWWDVRTDWDTLFHVYGIKIGKVRDIQLMELLSRHGQKSNICGLSRAMRAEGSKFMSLKELEAWLDDKQEGGNYFKENGWRPLTARPINETAKRYIAGDTDCLFQLHNQLQLRLGRWAFTMQGNTVGGLMDLLGKRSTLPATEEDLMEFIDQQSAIRAHYATSPGFNSKSQVGKTIPPAAFLRITDFWENNYTRMEKRREERLQNSIW